MDARRLAALAFSIALAQRADALAAPQSRADCDAPTHASVLQPTALSASARAYWLDERRLQWPGAEPAGRFRLHWSLAGVLEIASDGRVQGADGALDLSVSARPLPAALRERFRFVGAGPLLELPPSARTRSRELLRAQTLITREVGGRVVAATRLQTAGVLDDLYAAPAAVAALGATPSERGIEFSLWAPTARAVGVCVHADANGPAIAFEPLRFDARAGTWRGRVDGTGRLYRYLVDVHVRGTGLVRNRVTDPYSVSLTADSRLSYAAHLDDPALAPPGWRLAHRPPPLASQTDLVVYELHVRDYSRDDATVPAEHRGRYLAFADAHTDGARQLRALAAAGITDVHLLPVFDFATVPERGCVTPAVAGGAADGNAQATVVANASRDCFNWGYDPLHFGAPEGSYSSDADDPAKRILEFRAMVQSLHAAGLRVGMDVVYNHTMAAGQDPLSVLDRIVPDYYHRLDAAGEVERSTCCANTATEHAMMARLMIDTAVRWARDYRIDSFRFDLMGHQPRAAMERLRVRVAGAAGRPVPLIGEGWNFGEIADGARFVQASQLSLGGSGIATFSDRARDAVRGGGPGDRGSALVARRGWATGLASDASAAELRRAADGVRIGLAGTLRDYRMTAADGRELPLSALRYAGQAAGYAHAPAEVVNYVENHDNHTLFDTGAFKLPLDLTTAERARAQALALAVVAFSQGVAYFHAGGELLRSKSLDRNSFDSGDWFNLLDWSGRATGFARGLPPAPDNELDWSVSRERLSDPRLVPTSGDVAWTRRAFLDLLRMRASSTLFRLRTARDVERRLTFVGTGPEADGAVIAAHVDGAGYAGARFRAVFYALNAAREPREIASPLLRDAAWTLHPVQQDPAGDEQVRRMRVDRERGTLLVPPLTAIVLVR